MKTKSFTGNILAVLLIAALAAALLSSCGGSGVSNSTTTSATNTTTAATTTAETSTTTAEAANTTTTANTTAAASTAAAATEGTAKLTPWGYDASDIYVIKQLGTPNEYWKRFSETDVGAVILDKFGIDFEFISYIETLSEKERLLLASGDYYDIASMHTSEVRDAYIYAGALVPLDDYLEKMTEFKRVYVDQIPYWRSHAPDNKLYYWEGNATPVRTKRDIITTSCGMIRADILELYADQYGWDKTPIYSDDWLNVFKIASEADLKDVDGNKMTGTISCFGESWAPGGLIDFFFEDCIDYPLTSSRTMVYNYAKDIYEPMLETDLLKNEFKFFNSLWNMGMLDEESFTDLYAQTLDKSHKASAAGIWYISWEEETANEYIREAGHPEMQYVKMPVISDLFRGKRLNAFANITNDYYNIGVTKNAKNPGRIFELLNYLDSDEGAMMSANGIEGKHWEYKDGLRVEIKAFYDKAKDDLVLRNMSGIEFLEPLGFPTLYTYAADGYPILIRRSNEYFIRNLNPDYLPNIIRAKFGLASPTSWILENSDIKFLTVPATVSFEPGSEFDIINGRMLEVREHHSYDVLTAKEGEFEKAYQDMLDEYHTLDVQKVYDEYNRIGKELAAAVKPK